MNSYQNWRKFNLHARFFVFLHAEWRCTSTPAAGTNAAGESVTAYVACAVSCPATATERSCTPAPVSSLGRVAATPGGVKQWAGADELPEYDPTPSPAAGEVATATGPDGLHLRAGGQSSAAAAFLGVGLLGAVVAIKRRTMVAAGSAEISNPLATAV